MSENLYVDSICTEEVKRRGQVAIALDTYVIAEAVRSYRINTEIENSNKTGGDTAWSRCYRVTAVCVVLLCVLLLTAVTLLWIKYNNLTIERDQLQTSNNNLTTERDQFQRERDQFHRERDQLQRERAEHQRFLELGLSPGWIYFSSSVYIINTGQKTWTESRENCRERGADLVIINSRGEQEFVNKLRGGGQAWIGLSNRDRENKWKWVDDTTLITEFWGSGGPNSTAGEDRCFIIGKTTDPVKNWGVDPCNKTYNWICEKTIFN